LSKNLCRRSKKDYSNQQGENEQDFQTHGHHPPIIAQKTNVEKLSKTHNYYYNTVGTRNTHTFKEKLTVFPHCQLGKVKSEKRKVF